MNLVHELNFTKSIRSSTFSTFTHRILSNNTVNYYMNDDTGISIYDQDWNFIRRIDLHSVKLNASLRGNIFIHDQFIYIGNFYFDKNYHKNLFLKLDFDLNIINYKHFYNYISTVFDSCRKVFFLLWIKEVEYFKIEINIDVYNVYLRKISEINSTSINSAFDRYIFQPLSTVLGSFNNQLYISYKDRNNFYESILVTDINGQYITTIALIGIISFQKINSFIFDHFGNILFTRSQICLFSTFLKQIKCNEKTRGYLSFYNDPLFAQMDQSGRLVVIDSMKQKVQFYGPFEAKSKIFIFV
jgi:hypothetical protein